MVDLPAQGEISDNARTEGEIKTILENIRDFIEQLFGGNAEGAYTIASGVVTPIRTGAFTVDTESAAASDNLDTIATTNFAAGSVLIVRQLNAARDVTVRHLQGGSGQIQLADGANFNLAETDVRLVLMLVGTTWVEMERWYGNQDAAFRAFRGFGTVATLNFGSSAGQVPRVDEIVGRETAYVPARTMISRATDGATGPTSIETATNDVNYDVFEFPDGATATAVQFDVVLPKSWDGGTIKVQLLWGANSASTNTVAWFVRALSISDGDSDDAAFGTAVEIDDANTGTRQLNRTAESAAITISGSPGDLDLITIEIERDPTDGNDNLAATAELRGAIVFFDSDAINDD